MHQLNVSIDANFYRICCGQQFFPLLKELLYLCTKYLHFTFNDEIYTKTDGVAMGSPLGPLLTNIFMTSLKENVIPSLSSSLCNWKIYAGDTHADVDHAKVDMILYTLNNFHPNIKFTFELEQNNTINFLDVTIKKSNNNDIETTTYRNTTITNIYIHCNSRAPVEWKTGTLINLLKRAKTVFSNDILLDKEVKHLMKMFHEINGYPKIIVNRIIQQDIYQNQRELKPPESNDTSNKFQLILPYSGKQGNKLIEK